MPYIHTNTGARLYYEQQGNGTETIVFSHGLLLNNSMFANQIDALKKHYRTIAYDHRGQGNSQIQSPDNSVYDMDTLCEDAASLIEQLAPKQPVHFVGLSMGGFVGMRLAARKPQLLRSLTLLNTSAAAEPQASRRKYALLTIVVKVAGTGILANKMMDIMFGRSFLGDDNRQTLRRQWKKHLSNLPKNIIQPVKAVFNRLSVENEISRISCPVLIIGGTEDKATPPKLSEKIKQLVPHARLIILEKTGHSSTIEAPQEVTSAIQEFIRSNQIIAIK